MGICADTQKTGEFLPNISFSILKTSSVAERVNGWGERQSISREERRMEKKDTMEKLKGTMRQERKLQS